MLITYYMIDTHACGRIRAEEPARAFNEIYFNEHAVICKTNASPSDLTASSILVFQRQYALYPVLEAAKVKCIPSIYDIDDNIWELPSVFQDYGNKSIHIKECTEFMKKCHYITVSTPELQEVVQGRVPNKKVIVVPNVINLDLWQEGYTNRLIRVQDPQDTVTIGWMASQSHLIDFPLVEDILLQLLNEFKNLKILFIGWIFPDFFGTKKLWAPFQERVSFLPWQPYEVLPYIMKDIDIGILPLTDHPYNRCKSDVKFLQNAAMAIPSVASKIPPFNRVPEECILFAQSSEQWYSNLKLLITDEKFRKSLGLRARRYVEQYFDARLFASKWLELFKKIRNTTLFA